MKRVLIKVSGEMLQGLDGSIFDVFAVEKLAKTLLRIQEKNIQIVVVVGGGNIRRSRDTLDMQLDETVSGFLGMTGTIMNAVVVSKTIQRLGGNSIVFSPITQIPNGTHVYESDLGRKALAEDNIVFCAGGLGVPFSTTDSAAIQRALELSCDTVIKATKVDGVYTKDPNKFSDATRYDEITYDEALEKQLDIMDHHAFALARRYSMVLYISHMDMLDLVGTNAMNGTRVYAK